MKYALPTQLKIPIGLNRCFHQKLDTAKAFPLGTACSVVLRNVVFRTDKSISTDGRISFLRMLSADPPFLNPFTFLLHFVTKMEG